jgi:rod shape determining protein RodA
MSGFSLGQRLSVEKREGRTRDWGLLITTLLLIGGGLLSLASIDADRDTNYATKQMMFAAIGIGVFYVFNTVRLEFFRSAASILYVVNILLLVATRFAGKSRGMAERWIAIGPLQFQTSEVSKLLLAITLAAYFANREEKINEPSTFYGALIHAAPILALILAQPHLGATLALLFMTLNILIQAGSPWKFFPVTVIALIGIGFAGWFIPGLMPEYMRGRVEAKLDQYVYGKRDPRGSDYQQEQAMLAIGSGGASGTGFFQGEQKAAGVIPDQQTDFVFSVIGEEGGFTGSVLVIGLFGAFFFFVWRRVFLATSMMSRLVAAGLFAVLAFHTIVNLAMVLRFGPVVGLWLPFMSSGGTALWMCMGAVGLIEQCE